MNTARSKMPSAAPKGRSPSAEVRPAMILNAQSGNPAPSPRSQRPGRGSDHLRRYRQLRRLRPDRRQLWEEDGHAHGDLRGGLLHRLGDVGMDDEIVIVVTPYPTR
jgi:hypothetical protein